MSSTATTGTPAWSRCCCTSSTGEVMPGQRVCYTIHNFRHQGVTGPQVLRATQLGRHEHFLHADRLGDDTYFRAANLMKGGVVYSNFVTTVSPSHAGEARSGDGGFGLGNVLRRSSGQVRRRPQRRGLRRVEP